MGWSCSARAGRVLDRVVEFCKLYNKTSNTWTACGITYFFEESRRTHADGAITGTVYRNLNTGFCRKVGSFRIDGDGKIIRFPGFDKAQRMIFERDGVADYERTKHYLSGSNA